MSCLNYCNPACDPELGGHPDSGCFKLCGRHKNLVAKAVVVASSQTASQTAKQIGCKSLSQVSQLTGVSLQTLSNWHKDKLELFRVVCAGVVALTQGKQK
jgi:hypothetical protein